MSFSLNKETVKKEGVILVTVVFPGEAVWDAEELLDELAFLTETAGGEVKGKVIQRKTAIDSHCFVGRGKAAELKEMVKSLDADTIIFDNDLLPRQAGNLQEITGVKVIDRSALILDIFAIRARTRESMTQVELAQLEYWLPRLAGQWTHLERQAGGIGMRGGPGEKQIEVDRRIIKDRIARLKKELRKISSHRDTQRKRREKCFRIALVGYTNAGKSTILNALTGAGVLVEDKLFATIDPTVRVLEDRSGQKVLISDTVGFIRRLPHDLVASFRSTLEEAKESDLLLNVIDISYPNFEEHIKTTEKVLAELGMADNRIVKIFNKQDLVPNGNIIHRAMELYPGSIITSAADEKSRSALKSAILEKVKSLYTEGSAELDKADSEKLSIIYELAEVIEQKYEEDKILLDYRVSPANAKFLENLLRS